MGRGSWVWRRAMSGRVKRTDGENGVKCVFRGQKGGGEGIEKDGVGNGEVIEV